MSDTLATARSPGIMRKRSQARLDHKSHEGWRYSPVPSGHERLPTWQVAVLLLLSVALLYLALSWTSPRARAAKSWNSHLPKCFPLDDKDRVRLLGSQNTLVHRPIATSSEWAQTLFDLGLLALAGFNQLEATGMFEACLRADPTCSMCHWGLAYSQGPMPNKVPGKLGDPYPAFLATHATDAYGHAQAALRHNHAALGASQLEMARVRKDKLFIEALAGRFKKGAAALKADKWREHEAKYAQRMQHIAEEEQDADAFALAAEAFMNLTPWDYYNPDGSLRPTAATAEQLILKALKLQPKHPHALHLHVHIAEAGSAVADPGRESVAAFRGLRSAEQLAELPVQNGHLLHMPSHIFVRVGQYKKAVMVNKAAYDFDVARGQQCIIPYLPEHNVNLLVYAASMAGMYHTAEAFATGMRSLRTRLPDTWMAKGTEYVNLPNLYIRYGQWDKLLSMRPPGKDARGVTALGGAQYAQVVYHTGRLLALTARAQAAHMQVLGVEDVTAFDLARKSLDLREKEVAHEHTLLQHALDAVPDEPLTRPGAAPGMYASAYRVLGSIAMRLASARLQLLRNNTAAAIDALREAAVAEDSLGYMEPPRVHQPVRQCLGWLLLHAGQFNDAWRVYSQDLRHHPNNGWSLLGLKQVAEARGEGAAEAAALFKAAWADAEIDIGSSCPSLAQAFAE